MKRDPQIQSQSQPAATVTLVIGGQVYVGTGKDRDEALANLAPVSSK